MGLLCSGRLAAVLLSIALAGCAVGEQRQQARREALTRRIVDDAIAYNEAYNGAISGQILLNIMRAYNRQPRQYMSMSGFTNTPVDSEENGVSLSDLPLGELGEAWGMGGLTYSATTHREPEYKVEPFSTQTFAQISFRPTPASVLRHYWEDSWSAELLLLVMVDRIETESLSSGARETLWNSASSISLDCTEGVPGRGCNYVREVRRVADVMYRTGPSTISDGEASDVRALCGLIAAYGPTRAVRATHPPAPKVPPAAGAPGPAPVTEPAEPCVPSIVVEDRIHRLTLRSLDGMVFYVGELLRGSESPEELNARVTVFAPGGNARVPIFRVTRTNSFAEERRYAASATYSGARYSAGPGANNFCGFGVACAASAADRSGSVLELLVGILAYNQSESAVSAPEPRTTTTTN